MRKEEGREGKREGGKKGERETERDRERELIQKDTQFRNKWRKKVKWQLADLGLPRKWPSKRCMCVVCVVWYVCTGIQGVVFIHHMCVNVMFCYTFKGRICACICRVGCSNCVVMAQVSLHMSVEHGGRNTSFLYVTPTSLVCFILQRSRSHHMMHREVVFLA